MLAILISCILPKVSAFGLDLEKQRTKFDTRKRLHAAIDRWYLGDNRNLFQVPPVEKITRLLLVGMFLLGPAIFSANACYQAKPHCIGRQNN